ncbi:MAG: hypothetical protein NVSMB18_29690 [Acetobacteraceae bacterium]
MFGSEVIEVGIGIALLFLFMSLIATALRELIENAVMSRSRDLEAGIKELLSAATDPKSGKDYVKMMYEHPLITSLYQGAYVAGGRSLPSYIPRQSFSLALLDIVAEASKTGKQLSIESLRARIGGTPTPVERAVLTAIDAGKGDLDRTRKAIEDWYDGTMDRVSGWYTRRTGRILSVLGLITAIAFNVDAITIASSLLRDKALREAVVAQAETYLADHPAAQTSGVTTSPANTSPARAPEDVGALRARLDKVGFPIGWTVQDGHLFPVPQACRPAPEADSGSLYRCATPAGFWFVPMVFGWLITALAITLGAPFWFDVLNKFMVVRSTIKPKEKSPDEASPERQKPEIAGKQV